MTRQLRSLFSQLQLELDMTESEEKDYLLLDHNNIYGGYILMVVHPKQNYSQSFFLFSSRMSCKEMTALIQGLISGLYWNKETKKFNNH